jgi:hypothetical protein
VNKYYTGTWNVMTVLKLGKTQELSEQVANTQSEKVTVRETRWSGNYLNTGNNYSLYYSGFSERGQADTAIIVVKKALKYIFGLEPYN